MRRRILEWGWFIALLLSIGLAVAGSEGTLAESMGPVTIRYAELTIPGLSYHWHHDTHLREAHWSLELTLLIPLVLLLVILGLSWRRLRKGRRPLRPSPQPMAH
jgi:hypothetical protein